MILYHASKEVMEFPEIRKTKYTKDFSWGFYCMNNLHQAIRWANRGFGDPIVNIYHYEHDPALSILKFEQMTDEWLDFIARYRSGETHRYDIVEGPMANDTAWLLRGVRLLMTEKERNDYFYVCALIEYTARKTLNRRGTVVRALGEEGIEKQLYDAELNHCLSFEQVSDEIIEQYKIPMGNFDTITECKYTIPGFMDIGKLYSIMIEDCSNPGEEVKELISIFTSFISDKISDFNTDLYYQNPSYLECSYKAGYLLD